MQFIYTGLGHGSPHDHHSLHFRFLGLAEYSSPHHSLSTISVALTDPIRYGQLSALLQRSSFDSYNFFARVKFSLLQVHISRILLF